MPVGWMGGTWIVDWIRVIIHAFFQGSLVMLLVWGFIKFCPRTRPSIQCWLWRLAYLKLLLSLFRVKPVELGVHYAFKEIWTRWATEISLHRLNTISAQGGSTAIHSESGSIILFLLWFAGFIGFTVVLISTWRKQRAFCHLIHPAANPDIMLLYREIGDLFRLRKTPSLFISRYVSSPVLLGPVKPKIVLPASVAETYPPDELRLILAHELAHYRRGDLLWNWLPTLVRIIFFFNPLIWLTKNEWILAHEMRCDDEALQITGVTRLEYGRLLLRASFGEIFKRYDHAATFNGSTSAMELRKRLQALKTASSSRPGVSILSGFILLTMVAVLLIPWRLTEAESLPVNLWINYATPAKQFEIAAHVILPPQEVVKTSLWIDDQKLSTYHPASNMCFSYAKPSEKSFPKKGPHKVSIEVLTKKGSIKEQNWIFFQDSMNWSNRYLGVHNYKTVLKLGPFICVFDNRSPVYY